MTPRSPCAAQPSFPARGRQRCCSGRFGRARVASGEARWQGPGLALETRLVTPFHHLLVNNLVANITNFTIWFALTFYV
ncbi:MAG: hypothetical protein ACOVOE_10845, partial [Caulobacter sp.]